MANEKIFPKGFYFNRREGAPVYVIGSVSIKVPELIPFLEAHQNNAGYVNIDILTAQTTGKPYCALNTYQPQSKPTVTQEAENQEKLNNMSTDEGTIEYPDEQISSEDIPF